MPIDANKALAVWTRYVYARDNGHSDFVLKADLCERFFQGDQWDSRDKAELALAGRPAITINKILSTVSNIMGEQIYNRSEIAFRPRSGSPSSIAETLTKVFKQISDNNQLDWKRSDAFADGVIAGRGFLDARVQFDEHMQGEVKIEKLNHKNVIIDPDGEEYDPDTWNEVMITKWLTADDIAILYNKEDAEQLRNRPSSALPFGYDSIDDIYRSRFGKAAAIYYIGAFDESSVRRNIRVIERQWRTLDKQKHFVSMQGDTRPVPANWDRDRIAMFLKMTGFNITTKLVHRIKWNVVADNFVLHEAWSPYKHFTVIPYFPIFRQGKTIGLVENLLGPQEVLNKTTSQELHVVNTTANSGWKVKAGALTNMSLEELEQFGAKSGLVVEVNGDPEKDVVKITPNSIPQGLERMSYKAEESIKTISGISDSMQGMDREDVAAKAIQAKQKAGQTNLAKPLDSLARSDFILARNVLDIIQGFYTEERILTITKDAVTGETQDLVINQVQADGTIINDLTLGTYSVVVSNVPQRETLEDSQFDQAIAMRQEGIQIPDEVVIQNSRLYKKDDIVKQLRAQASTPEAQAMQQAQLRTAQATADETEGAAADKHASAALKLAKAGAAHVAAQKDAATPVDTGGAPPPHPVDLATKLHGMHLAERQQQHQEQVDYATLQETRQHNVVQERLQAQEQAEAQAAQRAQAAVQTSQQSQQPNPEGA